MPRNFQLKSIRRWINSWGRCRSGGGAQKVHQRDGRVSADEAIARVAEVKSLAVTPWMGDIAAYALNRLPPLYATTEEGSYQRLPTEELQELVSQIAARRSASGPPFSQNGKPSAKTLATNCLGKVPTQAYAPLSKTAPESRE